jgi:hypothetical protein
MEWQIMTSLGKLSLLAFLIVAAGAASAQVISSRGSTTTTVRPPPGGIYGVNGGLGITNTRDLDLRGSLATGTSDQTITELGTYTRSSGTLYTGTDGTTYAETGGATTSEAYSPPAEDPALDAYIASGGPALIESLPTVGKMRRTF